MGFFQQLRQAFGGTGPVFQDLSFGLIDSLGVREMLRQYRWETLETTAAGLAPDDLTRLLDGLCLTTEYADYLAQFEQSGASEFQQLVSGVHTTYLAWQARSAVYAQYLSGKQVEDFTTCLNQAWEYLNQPFQTTAFQPEAAARLVRVAMGLSEPDLAQEAFEHSLDVAPTHLQAHAFYFNVLTPKWFGGEAELKDFVESAPLALRTLLQAMYIIELYQEIADSGGRVKQDFKRANAPWLDELLALRPLKPGVGESVLYSVYLNNYLAAIQHELGDTSIRNEFLRVLGSAITYYPWMYFNLSWQEVSKLAASSK